jgi:hypothetical protein
MENRDDVTLVNGTRVSRRSVMTTNLRLSDDAKNMDWTAETILLNPLNVEEQMFISLHYR